MLSRCWRYNILQMLTKQNQTANRNICARITVYTMTDGDIYTTRNQEA